MATTEKKPDGPLVLMIDNETLGLGPTAHLTQVGFVVGNVETGEILVPATNAWMVTEQSSAKIDVGTVGWWMEQDRGVAASVFIPPEGTRRITPRELFELFTDMKADFPDMTVYGSPAMFDLPQLTHMFGDRKPWKYNAERDLMTLYKLIDPLGVLQPPANPMHHNAAADAEWQFKYLVNVLGRLRAMQATWGQMNINAIVEGLKA